MTDCHRSILYAELCTIWIIINNLFSQLIATTIPLAPLVVTAITKIICALEFLLVKLRVSSLITKLYHMW